MSFGGEGTWSDRAFELTLPYKAARLPSGANRSHVRSTPGFFVNGMVCDVSGGMQALSSAALKLL